MIWDDAWPMIHFATKIDAPTKKDRQHVTNCKVNIISGLPQETRPTDDFQNEEWQRSNGYGLGGLMDEAPAKTRKPWPWWVWLLVILFPIPLRPWWLAVSFIVAFLLLLFLLRPDSA